MMMTRYGFTFFNRFPFLSVYKIDYSDWMSDYSRLPIIGIFSPEMSQQLVF